MSKNVSMNGSRQKQKIFTGVVFINCLMDGKIYKLRCSMLGIKHFCHSTKFKEFSFHFYTCDSSRFCTMLNPNIYLYVRHDLMLMLVKQVQFNFRINAMHVQYR